MKLLRAGWNRARSLPRWSQLWVPVLCAALLAVPAAWPAPAGDEPLLTRVTGPAAPATGGVDVAAAEVGPPSTSTPPPTSPPTTQPPPVPDQPAATPLRRFESCEALVARVKQVAAEVVTPYGLPSPRPSEDAGTAVTTGGAAAGGATAPAAAAPAGEPTPRSRTNTQEEGVDEPDLVESNGTHLFISRPGQVVVVEASGREPRIVATHVRTDGGESPELLLAGDRLLVIWDGSGPAMVEPNGRASTQLTRLELFDVSSPTSPRLLSTVEVNGARVGARAVDGLVRLVVRAGPMGLFTTPEDASPEAAERSLAHNRQAIAASTAVNWLPLNRAQGAAAGGDAGTEPTAAVDCDAAYEPTAFAGLDTVSVVTFDMAQGRLVGDGATVFTSGEVTYATRDRLYVASSPWSEPGGAAVVTSLHQFVLAPGGAATYTASGAVRGYLLNQFSLSEHEGRLRVASTDGVGATSESFVTVLEPRAGALVPVGLVGGLGRGELLYTARFMGELGFVVTFRKVDPLYVVDLSDPTSPVVRGELKILGYSAYLHPVGDGLLLGIGQDSTEDGWMQGTQVSLFDVSDPTRPTRVDQLKFGERGTHSEAELDHHAFLWWEPASLALAPYESFAGGAHVTGVVAVRMEDRRLKEVARIGHVGEPGADDVRSAVIRRSVVVGTTLYTVSDSGVMANDVSTFARKGWASFD